MKKFFLITFVLAVLGYSKDTVYVLYDTVTNTPFAMFRDKPDTSNSFMKGVRTEAVEIERDSLKLKLEDVIKNRRDNKN